MVAKSTSAADPGFEPYLLSDAMPPHPSLTAKFEGPPPFRPRESMGAYETCWCGSGKKYKWCHHRRSEQPKVEIFKVDAQLRALGERGYCSHPHAAAEVCSKISKAHTVQRRGGLAAISEENHVLTVKPTMKGMIDNEGAPGPRRIGIGQASVFPGFCSLHDTELFRPVEGKDVGLTAETALLMGFRAVAYERFAKALQLETFEITRQMDCGQSFWHQQAIQGSIYPVEWGVRRGLRDVNRWKQTYDQALSTADTSELSYVAIRFDRVLPIVGCGAFHAELDLEGNQLQRLMRGDLDFEYVAWNATVFDGRSVVVFSSICQPDGPAEKFMSTVGSLPDARKADAMVRIAFEQSDNLFLTPSWWFSLTDADRAFFSRAAHSGTPHQARTANCFMDRGTNYASAEVVETVVSLRGL